MEPIFTKYIPETKALLLPWQEVRPYADLPEAPFAAPDVIPLAEALFDKPIPALPASLYRQFYENGNRVNYETPYFERRKNLLLLAVAEKTEGRGRFLDLLVDYIWAICEETTWVIPAHLTPRHGKPERLPDHFDLEEGDDCHNIDLFAAATGADMAMVWYLLHDELDALTPVASLSDSAYGEDSPELGAVIPDQADADDMTRHMESIALGQVIDTLPPDWKKIVLLRYYRDMTQQQVADIMGLTQVKVSREEKKIMAYMREKLGG